MSLQIVCDHAQERMTADRLGIIAGGLDWNGSEWEGTWIDPLTDTLMLRPRPLDAEWFVSSTGAYSKLGLTSFSSTSGWEERRDQHWAGPWLGKKDSSTGGSLMTTAGYDKNRGFFVAWFSYGTGDTFLQFKCGWSDTGDDSAGVSLHFWTDGMVEIFRDGRRVGDGRISGATGNVRRNQVFEAILLPMRGRELMVLSKAGHGFVHLFSELDPEDPDPEITPAGRFWFEVVSGGAQVQVAPLKFWESGYATTLATSFSEAPLAGELLEQFDNETLSAGLQPFKVYGSESFGPGTEAVDVSLVQLDGVTAFVADGEATDVRLRAELTSTNDGYTPFVYGAAVAFQRQTGLTDSAEFDLSDLTLEAALSVPDDATRVTFDFEISDPLGAESFVPGLVRIGNKPILAKLDGQLLVDGSNGPASVDLGVNGEATTAVFEVRDAWKPLENSVFAERIALDGLLFEEAVRLLVGRSGVSGLSMSAGGGRLPFLVGERSGRWGLLIEPGDSAGDWLKRLLETFAATWTWGFRPTLSGTEFFALAPDDLPTTASRVLYGSVEDAELIGGYADGKLGVFRSFRQRVLEPEATEVRVTGVDPATGRPIQSVRIDGDAQTVGLPVDLRPLNWVGEIRRFGLVDAGLTRASTVDAVCDEVFLKMSQPRVLAEFESDFLVDAVGVPLWRGDVVELFGLGLWRIVSFGCQFGFEASGGVWRGARYSVELIS